MQEEPDLASWEEEAAGDARRYRAERLSSRELRGNLECAFRVGDDVYGPMEVLDASPTGLGLLPDDGLELSTGASLDAVRIRYHGDLVWEGQAVCVYLAWEPTPRLGLMLTSSLFDRDTVRLRDAHVDGELERRLAVHRTASDLLPPDWRAGVADLRHLLQLARDVLDGMEKEIAHRPEPSPPIDEVALLDAFLGRWAPVYVETLRQMHERSEGFGARARGAGRAYASRMLMPLLGVCLLHRRAYDKPLGHAGDYRLMTMYAADNAAGETLFARFLYTVAQRSPIGRMVRARERYLRDQLRDTLSAPRPVRIAAVGCGAAPELLNAFEHVEGHDRPIDILLVDGDDHALEACRTLFDRRMARSSHPALSLRFFQTSVEQLLAPGTPLRRFDLAYSAGLLDTLSAAAARALVVRLSSSLSPGGRLLLGAARRQGSEEAVWLADYVVHWPLRWWDDGALAALSHDPEDRVQVCDVGDACAFLEVTRAASPTARI